MMQPAPATDAYRRAGATEGVYLGRYYNDVTGEWLPQPLVYADKRHGLLFGPTGTGKTTRWLMSNLLGDYLRNYSVVVTDPKGELATVCAKARIELGQNVRILDPFGKLSEIARSNPAEYAFLVERGVIDSHGFDPLATLDPTSPMFYDDATAIAEALITIDDKDPHWSESASGLVTGLVMWEKLNSEIEKRPASLENVRRMLTEFENKALRKGTDNKEVEVPISGLRYHVAAALHALDDALKRRQQQPLDPQRKDRSEDIIASLLARFAQPSREIDSIRSNADTQTRWLLSKPMRDNLAKKPAIDFKGLKTDARPTTIFIIMPAERVRTHSAWIRLLVVCCLRALYTPGGRRTVFLLDEMPALGALAPLSDAFAIVRGFNLQIFGIAQDLVQLKSLYKERYESFMANAGVIQFFTPNDLTTGNWISQRAGLETVLVKNTTTSKNPQEQTTEGQSLSQDGKPLYSTYQLAGLTQGSGLLFLAGLSPGIRFYTPPYWNIGQTEKRALKNPYHSG